MFYLNCCKMIFYFIYSLLSPGSPAPDTKGLITVLRDSRDHTDTQTGLHLLCQGRLIRKCQDLLQHVSLWFPAPHMSLKLLCRAEPRLHLRPVFFPLLSTPHPHSDTPAQVSTPNFPRGPCENKRPNLSFYCFLHPLFH